MGQIFILDGPDATGKTTLAKELVEKTGGKYFHLTYRWKDRIFDYHTAAIRLAARSTTPVILDRWWPSEAVYAKAFREGSDWPLQGRMTDRIARKFGAIYVLCLPATVQECVDRHAQLKSERHEMYDDIRSVAELYLKLYSGDVEHEDKGQYIDFLIRTGGLITRFDVLHYSIETWGRALGIFSDKVIQQSNTWRKLQYGPALSFREWNIVGHVFFADYLFIGDQVANNFRELHWPFYEYQNGSLYLTKALHRLGFKEEHAMWCNALDHDGEVNKHIAKLKQYKPSLKLITLGNKAAEVCDELEIEVHAELPNPAFCEKFESDINLAEVLKHALAIS